MIEEIVAHKKIEVAARIKQTPLDSFQHHLSPSDRSLRSSLLQPGQRFILECKKASPSKGLIRPDFDVTEIAKTYAPFADAVSVICDEHYFQGELGFLAKVREIVPCPVLCKDFFVSPYQVYEARRYGADAILLMMSVLNDETYKSCASAARALNMDVLTEVHDERELERAVRLGAEIIGVNNRDFKTLKLDLNVSRRLIPLIPEDRVIVVESGIYTHEEILSFDQRAHAFLVGTSLMEQERLDLALRELIFGRVKICGLISAPDAMCAYDAGAVMGGLIFASESPRCVPESVALEMVRSVPLRWAGVFVNEAVDKIAALAKSLQLSAVQLHGEETAETIKKLRAALPNGVEIWKAFRVRDQIPDAGEWGADRLLLDTFRPGQRGGTGETFDWGLLKSKAAKHQFILSGGVSPENAAEGDRVGTWALDVNSKVEISPGKKSEEKLKILFANLRGQS